MVQNAIPDGSPDDAQPSASSAAASASDEPVTKKPKPSNGGPPTAKRAKALKFEETYLRGLPRASQYEKSFMHRDTVTHVFATRSDFLITASCDGHLKFWKKIYREGVEFVKHFRCHLSAFSDIKINHNGTLMATACAQEKTVKVFDVNNFDMINMFKLDFAPRVVAWVHGEADLVPAFAVADADSPKIHIFDAKGENKAIRVIENLHTSPVVLMAHVPSKNVVISIDRKGMLEYWSGIKTNFEFPTTIKWEYKSDTDLYEFSRAKQPPKTLAASPNGIYFVAFTASRQLLVFSVATGKIIRRLDETLEKYIEQSKTNDRFGLQNVDWTRKVALEKDMNKDPKAFDTMQLAFDESGNFVVYPSPVGIRMYNMFSGRFVREIGKSESARFIGLAVCRPMPTAVERFKSVLTVEMEASDNPALQKTDPDPMVIATAYKKNRFYIFTNAEPFTAGDDGDGATNRDVFNEKPRKEDALTAVDKETDSKAMTDAAIVHTTFGDIHVRLYPEYCPKTVENFVTLSRRGYYNGHVFHRVIKSFIIQTGDPTGKGTGGQSIWGKDFEDEFHPMLRHDKPFRLSMANAGPNTNSSQFFITVSPTEFLDGKNTLFGEVTDGFSVVQKINQVPTHERSGRPREEVSVVSISLKN